MVKNPFNIDLGYDPITGRPYKKKTTTRQPVATSQKRIILSKQKHKCARCHRLFGASVHYHHKKFVSSGGKSTTNNLVALCPSCHSDIHIEEKAKKADKKKISKSPQNKNDFMKWVMKV